MRTLDESEFLIEAMSPDALPIEEIKAVLRKNTFACIRGIISPQEIYQALKKIEITLDPSKDQKPLNLAPDVVRRNFQKLTVGGESRLSKYDDAKLFRAVYNPIWEDDIYGMRLAFTKLAMVRNVIAGMQVDFATDKIESNGLWTAARFHQYPAGGGFFRRHLDFVAEDISKKNEVDFYQLVLTMSKKGEHYHVGGAFVDINDERVCIDDYAEPGDIIIYDGRTMHGVEDIDPGEILDLQSLNGRLAGFATLYKKL